MRKEKSAGAVVFRREGKKTKYLLLHYESGHWDFPRGHIERGEKEQETARREILEETGIIELDFIRGFRVSTKWFFKKKAGKRYFNVHKTAVLFLAETKARRVKISHEHIGYKWLFYEKAVKQATFDNTKNLLEKAASFLNTKNKNIEKAYK